MAEVQDKMCTFIEVRFPSATGSLPVRYFGFPLVTKKMPGADYLLLLEKIRSSISSWVARFLSHVGRIQFIKYVIVSITNCWLGSWRLSRECIREIKDFSPLFSCHDRNSIREKQRYHG